jgi:DNA-binding CsgD family transcriptional regulator
LCADTDNKVDVKHLPPPLGYKNYPLVLLSDEAADAAWAYELDAVDFIPLPLESIRLQRCLDKLIRAGQVTANGYSNVLPKLSTLTKTERLVLYKIGEQKSTQQIADELFVTYKTVETHHTNIRSKLDFGDRRPLTPFASLVVEKKFL